VRTAGHAYDNVSQSCTSAPPSCGVAFSRAPAAPQCGTGARRRSDPRLRRPVPGIEFAAIERQPATLRAQSGPARLLPHCSLLYLTQTGMRVAVQQLSRTTPNVLVQQTSQRLHRAVLSSVRSRALTSMTDALTASTPPKASVAQ